jgi:hypothetical protein
MTCQVYIQGALSQNDLLGKRKRRDIYLVLKVYLISSVRDGEVVYKIGHTKREVHDRIKEFATGNSNEMTVESFFVSKWAVKIERALHRHFRTRRLSGEWFSLERAHIADFLRICQITHDGLETVEMYNNYVKDRGGVRNM